MAASGHFGWPKITFDHFYFLQNGCRRPFWMTENHFLLHFLPFQINTKPLFFFTKWLPAAILDDRKSLWIAFLAISYQYATLIFFPQNGCRWLFWMTENHFWSHISPFHINTQPFFYKMAAGGHFGWPKITFDRISRHFRSIRNFWYFFFSQNVFRRPFWMTEKTTFDRISRHFRSVRNFDFFSSQNGCRWPFWMTENHFRSHFSQFQINTQLFCSTKMTENHFQSHFSPFQINTQLLVFWVFFFSKWPPAAILEVRFGPKQ